MPWKVLLKVDWQIAANITTSCALVLAIFVFAWKIHTDRKASEFLVFIKFIDTYQNVMTNRHALWKKITQTVRSNPKTKHEIPDKTNSFKYLLLRIQQKEPLYAIEHELIEYELQSINLLNEICRYAHKNDQMAILAKAILSSEISFYKRNIQDILLIRNHAIKERTLSVPRYDSIQKIDVGDFFGEDLEI